MTGPHLTFNNHYYIECSIISVLYFSRQRYVLGDSAMQRMAKSSVLLCGMGGLGVEIGTYTTIVLGIVQEKNFISVNHPNFRLIIINVNMPTCKCSL